MGGGGGGGGGQEHQYENPFIQFEEIWQKGKKLRVSFKRVRSPYEDCIFKHSRVLAIFCFVSDLHGSRANVFPSQRT